MPIETIEFEHAIYPKFQSEGNAAQFCRPFAEILCKGVGYDIGCNRKEWQLPGSIPVDPAMGINEYDAYNLPKMSVDFIHSSHCLEHLPDWVGALDYWHSKLHSGGVMFLYLPHYSQTYWRNWNNRKHIHNLSPQMLRDYFMSRKFVNINVSEQDLNNSFYAVAEKA